ncbi:MAG: transcriptional regulator [Deltaproteobacteria bacterium]|nr:transcriptional regulator [Deltaproteobacteria bacterium]
MDNKEFHSLRKKLNKTQKQISELLGTSLRAVQSFEQGWRRIPPHVERQLLFLVSMKQKSNKEVQPCWLIRKCPPQIRQACPAWEFNAGHFCWFINGTLCRGRAQDSWAKKMKICRKCEVFIAAMKN